MGRGAIMLLTCLAAFTALAQVERNWQDRWGGRGRGADLDAVDDTPWSTAPPDAEFNFARMVYASGAAMWGGRFGGYDSWTTDWPEAEQHLIQGIRRMTRINSSDAGRVVRLMDDALFDYPMLYAVEVGRMELSLEEAARLRDYLLRGGFLVVDDFHGSLQWQSFASQMQRVFPDRSIVDIPDADAVMHVMFDPDTHMQIAGIYALQYGQTWEQDGFSPHWRGIYDTDGRLMVAINFNMDLGDAWEHADWPQYPEPMTAMAYRWGVNYIIYAMTH